MGWNNVGLFILQLFGLFLLKVIFKGLGIWVRSVEKKKKLEATTTSRIDKFYEEFN